MASHNVVFAIDVDYQSEELSFSADVYQNNLKQWILKTLLSLASKYGFEKLRWGYRFFHSRSVKSTRLITRGTDFKELQEKTFSDFEGELLLKVCANDKSTNEQHRHQPSPSSCVQNALKEILLDFQWDRPDITSPTKLTLRPRRSNRSTSNSSLVDDDHSSHGKNVLFVVSKCPHSKRQLEEFLSRRNSATGSHRDLSELVLPKCLIHMLIDRKVVLHWVDPSSYQVNNGDDCTGLRTITDALQQVAGKVIPLPIPGLILSNKLSNLCNVGNNTVRSFPTGSNTSYILSSEKTYKRAFPALMGTLYWDADEKKQTCGVTLEPVSCTHRHVCGPVEVTLRSVLLGFDTNSLAQYATESWILFPPDKSEQDQAAFQCLLKDLSIQASVMVAEVCEGGLVHSAVLSVFSSSMALLTIIQPLKSLDEEVLGNSIVSLKTTDATDSTDLPDVVSSVLNAIIKDDESSEETADPQIPHWANQEVQQRNNLTTEFTELWFLLSDQSGISCHLMESMRLLHAAPEKQEHEKYDTLDLTRSLAELYQNSKAAPCPGLKGKKRGAQRTPVRQKMKSMSRSLQMLNFARFNVKAQKSQSETDCSSSTKETEKRSKRSSGEREKAGPMHFKNEEELISHLKLSYQQAVEDKSQPLSAQVQDLLSMVKTFISSSNNTGASLLDLIKKNILKSMQSIRQLYGSASDTEKIQDCQLQVLLRLELCKQPPSDDPDLVEQMVEEMAGMLRIISLTKDPVYLSKFMQEEVLQSYMNGIPKILADIYHSLGTQLPEALVPVLPSDFFSDDSMANASVSVSPTQLSATHSQVCSVGDRLEELRNRSAKKRRSSMLTRRKSMTDATQALRQIEMPRKSTRQAKAKCVPVENVSVGTRVPQKQAVQEVTKVRRNLFNQESLTPSKKGKMPRSQSVSAVEGIKKRKRSPIEDERHSLLPKKVSETPLHKQVSNRLLHRQRSGRKSGESDLVMVEESPVKPATDLRRSPRIKKLARRHSTVFYSSSQPRSRNFDRALSSSQLPAPEGKGGINIRAVTSPLRLLFGAAESPGTSSMSLRSRKNEALHFLSTDSVFENSNKTPNKSPHKRGSSAGSRSPRTPSSNSKGQTCSIPKSPGPTAGENGMVLRGSPFRSPATKSLVIETPKKSPLKGILRTPVKSFMECGSPSGSSLKMITPRKSVTWSPSPQKPLSTKPFKVPESSQSFNKYSSLLLSPGRFCRDQCELHQTPEKSMHRKNNAEKVSGVTCSSSPQKHLSEQSFKIPESPRSTTRYSPRLMTPSKLCSDQIAVYKSPEKSSQPKSRKSSERASGVTSDFDYQEPKLGQHTEKARRTLSLSDEGNSASPNMLFIDHSSPSIPEIKTPRKSPGPTHRMCTRSGRTPLKQCAALDKGKSLNISSNPNKDVHSSLNEKPTGTPPFSTSDGTNDPKGLSNENETLDCDSWITKDVDATNESTQGMMEASSSDSQYLESSQFSGTTTEESIDITDASVIKTELTGAIKMNIRFSRKSSTSNELFEFTSTQPCPAETTQERRYGFRQTPDRQQRKAAARLGYSNGQSVFSTPQASRTPAYRRKKLVEPNPLTYQVELEMQTSGLPKLKFKRTDSFSSNEASDCAAKALAPQMNAMASRVDSPLAHCFKHREPGCISPSSCTHETPGKGGIQTYICQAITPTRCLTSSPSPLGPGEPWTPSPQSVGRSTPENFSTWPRKKRARTCLLRTKESGNKEETGFLEDPELDGVFRLLGTEELKDLRAGPTCKYTLGTTSKLCSSEKMDWSESVQQGDKRDSVKCDELSVTSGKGSHGSVATPPHTKVKKPVSASGIFALTQSPLLYKGKKPTVTKETTQSDDLSIISEQCGNKGMVSFEVSPFTQHRRHQRSGRTYSRKRLLDS